MHPSSGKPAVCDDIAACAKWVCVAKWRKQHTMAAASDEMCALLGMPLQVLVRLSAHLFRGRKRYMFAAQ